MHDELTKADVNDNLGPDTEQAQIFKAAREQEVLKYSNVKNLPTKPLPKQRKSSASSVSPRNTPDTVAPKRYTSPIFDSGKTFSRCNMH